MSKQGVQRVGDDLPGGGEDIRGRTAIGFDRMDILPSVFGEYDRNLIHIETRLNVCISARGNRVTIDGLEKAVVHAEEVLRELYRIASTGTEITEGLIDAQVGFCGKSAPQPGHRDTAAVPMVSIRTRKQTLVPRNAAQGHYMRTLATSDMTFAIGPAGTGKTYLAVAQAVADLLSGRVERLILSRPAVEAGERLGFLPGDMKEKVDPYMRPIYDALFDCLPAEQVERKMAAGEIEIAPIAFMRGRTLANSFVLLDEAQNTTPAQMKMFLTRFGERSRMVICGDPRQVDLPSGATSGLTDALAKLRGVEGVAVSEFASADVVRHPLVGRIVEAYED